MSEPRPTLRLVLDTNVLLRSLVNRSSASRDVVQACEARKAITLLSKPLLDEYRRVLVHLRKRDPFITPFQIEAVLRRLQYLGDYARIPGATFSYSRDPTDAKLIELAIHGRATHIVSYDEDLLSAPASRGEAGKRFRQRLRGVVVCRPEELLRTFPELLPPL